VPISIPFFVSGKKASGEAFLDFAMALDVSNGGGDGRLAEATLAARRASGFLQTPPMHVVPGSKLNVPPYFSCFGSPV